MTTLGTTGPTVSRVGLGCMALSGMYGPVDEAQGIRTIQHALDRGITLIDTGDFYGMGHNERLVGRALHGRRDGAIVSVKFGALRDPAGGWTGFDGRPAAVKNFAAYSLDRLGIDHIDVYRPGRVDPATPIEDTVGAVAELIQAGFVRHVGLSEVGADTIRRAAAVHPIADLQIEYSLASRGPEASIFPTLDTLGISATLYGVFSRGLFTGSTTATGPSDFRAWLPRFQGSNAGIATAIAELAARHGRTPAQLALGWVLARAPGYVPLIGAKTPAHVDDALAVVDNPLTTEEIEALEALVTPETVQGTRYAAPMMAHLDSER